MLQNQTRQAFLWLFKVAMVALYYGRFVYARHSVRVAITDGDDDMIIALAGAFDFLDIHGIMLWGSVNNRVLLRRCYFHLFSLNFNTFYKSFKYSDGDVGKKVRDAYKYAAYHAETEAEFMHAVRAIQKFVRDHDVSGLFKPAAQLQLQAWIEARMCDYKQFARYVVYGLVDDMETTTNVAESAHHRLKNDPAVNNKAELRILVRSDIKAVNQLYTEHKVAHASRKLEISTSRVTIEIVARSHLVKHAADAVLKSFMDSKNYRVSACESESVGCALVWRAFAEDAKSKLPFKFDRGPRLLQKIGEKVVCPCPYFLATQLVCAHILAYNEGDFGPEDVHQRHLKQYYVESRPDCTAFQGCVARRRSEAAFVALPENEDHDHEQDADYDQHQDAPVDLMSNKQRGAMYSLLTQKSREVIEKWSSVTVAASKLWDLLNAFDTEMGDPDSYRVAGAPSSRPTPSHGSF